MRKEYMPLFIIFFLLAQPLLLYAASPIPGRSRTTQAKSILPKIPRINAKSAYIKYKTGNVILIDAMAAKNFQKSHILGAINLPNDGPKDLQRIRNARLPFYADQEILVYCK